MPPPKGQKKIHPNDLTPLQRRYLEFMIQNRKPTVATLARHFARSEATVREHLESMARKGWILRSKRGWLPGEKGRLTVAWRGPKPPLGGLQSFEDKTRQEWMERLAEVNEMLVRLRANAFESLGSDVAEVIDGFLLSEIGKRMRGPDVRLQALRYIVLDWKISH